MSSAAPSSGGSITCDNCHQTLPAGSDRCLYCGVVLRGSGPVGGAAGAPLVADVPEELRRFPVALADAGDKEQQRELRATTDPSATSAPIASGSALGPHFEGAPAGVGQRIAALTIDVAAIIVVIVAVALISRSAVLTAVATLEVLAILAVLQAREGIGLGTAILGLRVARVDAPFSPGTGRALMRGLVLAAGAVVALVGVWVVEASAAWDVRRRSWADRAAGTVVVVVPARSERQEERAARSVDLAPPIVQNDAAMTRAGLAAGAAGARRDDDADVPVTPDVGARGRPTAIDFADPAFAPAARTAADVPPANVEGQPAAGRSSVGAEVSASDIPGAPYAPASPVSGTRLPPAPAALAEPADPGAPVESEDPGVIPAPPLGSRRSRQSAAAQLPAATQPPALPPSGQARPPGPRRSRSAAPVIPPADQATIAPVVPPHGMRPGPPAPPPPEDLGTLILVFDTGQRASHPMPVAINLGRNPVADDATDVLIRVDDHESSVSRTHARLETDGVNVWVTDNGSTNGTDLIDESGRATALLPGVRTGVDDGDRVRVGNRVFTVGRLVEGRG